MARAAAPVRHQPWVHAGAAVVLLIATAVFVGSVDGQALPEIQNFLLVFGSLLVEAMPFILLGALTSAAIEVFVPTRVFDRIALLPKPLQMPVAGMGGLAFPVCECGSVPVARRLAAKGLSPAAAVTFMLASPIINPIVIASTMFAYRGRDVLWVMVGGRVVLGLLAAMAVGWVVSRHTKQEFLRPREEEVHEHGGGSRASSFFGHLSGDFLFMGKYLVVGAGVAAGLQTFVPQSILASVAGTPIVNLMAMMLLAFLLSLCSESDAFVAASFVQFGVGAQLAFLVFGPMVDTKLGFLYRGTFTKGFLTTVILVAGAVTLAGTLWIEVFWG